MIRTMVDGILQSLPTDEKSRIKVLLTSWVGHNKNHSEQLKKWAEKGESPGDNPVYDNVLQAAHEIEKANEGLSEALMELQREG